MRRKQGREIVYVERAGDSSAKWLFWGAALGAGLALLYAPRSGEETRRVLQRKLWKLRAMTEEKFDELAHDRKAEAQAAVRAGGARIRLTEALEDVGQEGGVDPARCRRPRSRPGRRPGAGRARPGRRGA